MKLRCVSRYTSSLGSYEPGQVFGVSDALGQDILNDGKENFELYVEPIEDTPAPDLSAMSTKTETGLVAPDRRGRGGRKRRK